MNDEEPLTADEVVDLLVRRVPCYELGPLLDWLHELVETAAKRGYEHDHGDPAEYAEHRRARDLLDQLRRSVP